MQDLWCKMTNLLPILMKDGYKVGHKFQYPEDTEFVYSNFTPRKSRVNGIDSIIFFGLQYFIKQYLTIYFNKNFFSSPKKDVVAEYKRRIENYLGKGSITYEHIEQLHDLGYLPLKIKAVPEGTVVPCGVPCLTIINTDKRFFWLTNMFETIMSNVLWKACTSATTAFEYRKNFEKYASITGGNKDFVKWQGHDFSFRGMSGLEDAMISGAAHLLSFYGTDTIPAIDFLERFYNADSDKEIVGGSVPATEHSVMFMGLPENEVDTFKRLINEVYPTGILSIVSDTWDFWNVVDNILPKIKDDIMKRNGKVVIRPDSGEPWKIICGDNGSLNSTVRKGAIERLWEIFGGRVNEKGFKELDNHIGLIYGDSITLDSQWKILDELCMKGFASTNVVLGIGSYTYQYVTRDTFGFVMKATWGQTKSRGGFPIFKDPKTSMGSKTSHRGLLNVVRGDDGILHCIQNCTKEQEEFGELKTVFLNGKWISNQSLSEIRQRLEAQL